MSTLFSIIIAFLSLIKSKIFLSLSSNSLELSKIAIIKSAESANFMLFSIPNFSITLSVSLIPAVSINFKATPLIFIYSSILSLVVPSMSLTIALSSFSIKFRSDDFPAFGLPKITVFIPFLSIFPFSNESSSFSNKPFIFFKCSSASTLVTSSTSYSG